MWVLLVMLMTSSGEVIAYDQGRFDNWSECRDTGKAMTDELGGTYTYTCIEFKKR